MQEKKKLASCEPMAFGRNALLQKHLEKRCHRLSKEHRTQQKHLDAESERCVIDIYSFLLEAELNEKQSREKQSDRNAKAKIIDTINYVSMANKKAMSQSSDVQDSAAISDNKTRARPLTAHGEQMKKAENDDLSKRPVSAYASLHQKFVIDSDDHDSVTDDKETELPKNPMNRRISLSTLRNMEKRTSVDEKAVLRPWQKIKQAVGSKSTDKAKERQPVSDNNENNQKAVPTTKSSNESKWANRSVSIRDRPKTADYYRRKHPDDERSEYWNRRVRNLILKWNVEDRGESYLERWDLLSKTSSNGPPPLLSIDPNMGEAEIKAKSFVRKYANKYRTLLRIASAPPQDTRQRRSEKITRQELASIHADIAKTRKNTRTILRKSKRLKMYVEQLAAVADDD